MEKVSDANVDKASNPYMEGFEELYELWKKKDIPTDGLLSFLREYSLGGDNNNEVDNMRLFRENIERSLLQLNGYIDGAGTSDQSVDAALRAVLEIAFEVAEGVFSTESVRTLIKALSRDEDVTLAYSKGVIEGRNARIVEEFRSMDKDKKPQNVPSLGTGFSSRTMKLGNSIFDLARDAKR